MRDAGKIVIVFGITILIWACYQYFSNEPTLIPEKPQSVSEGVQALSDLYSNVFEKAEKQAQAKDISVIGGIVVFIGCSLVFIGRKEKKSPNDD